ncbi:protein Star [Aricia agestis]|uniref:protein Star n=1 Tax=Aricia agestis TaxID=91739 RepID=UPI001C203E10|nr:protein Star [Aricia agestis]
MAKKEQGNTVTVEAEKQEEPTPTAPTNKAETPEPKQPDPTPKPTLVKVQVPAPATQTSRFTVPSFTKTPPNELYKKLLPAVLFLLTFVTVMTMLLIYMDTVALGAQQFRLNMSRDYELAKIPAESPTLVAYVRQLHLSPRPSKNPPPVTEPNDRVKVLDKLYGEIYNGTLVEILPRGGRDRGALYLEGARGWRGTAVRAPMRDFLQLRAAAAALHACLSPTHPREVSYQEDAGAGSTFSSRVLCLPLHTILLVADAVASDYVILAGDTVPRALTHLPYSDVRLRVIEFRSTDMAARNTTTEFLKTKNYTVAATFPDGVMYALQEVKEEQL